MGIPASSSGRLLIAALVGMAVAHLFSTLQHEGELPIFALVMELLLVGVAALQTTGRWWLSAFSVLLGALLFLSSLTGVLDRLADLSSPVLLGVFLFLALALLAVVAGVRYTMQLRRGMRPSGPSVKRA